MSILTEANASLREKELKDVYKIIECPFMEGYSLMHVLSHEIVETTFDDMTAATMFAERRSWTLRE